MPTTRNSVSQEKKLLIRLPKELHQELRQLAFELNISMAELCREGLDIVLKKHGKKVKGKPIK